MVSNTVTAAKRLQGDYMEMIKDPMPNIRVAPSPDNILVWNYVMIGKQDSPFEGGYYYGTIRFDAEYPYKPPRYVMNSESGRFQVGKEICNSISHFHRESWSPLWSIGGILTGFIEFFSDTAQTTFVGSASGQNVENYKKFARESKNNFIQNQAIVNLFPDIAEQIKQELAGAEPFNSLPFPPEHFEFKNKINEREKLIKLEQAAVENVLIYDSVEESDDE